MPKNHTESEEAKGEIATPEGLLGGNPKSSGSAPSGDFCLKDRRKILFKDCINSKNIVTIEFIFNEIEKQDKEFIKRLKEKIENRWLFIYEHDSDVLSLNKIIDKLSGGLE